MIIEAKATVDATAKANGVFNFGTNLKCTIAAYKRIETKDQVSFGSQPHYLPQLSFAQIPPKKLPTVSRLKPKIIDISLMRVASTMLLSIS